MRPSAIAPHRSMRKPELLPQRHCLSGLRGLPDLFLIACFALSDAFGGFMVARAPQKKQFDWRLGETALWD